MTERGSATRLAKAKNKDLVIVESPTKARTIGRFLKDGYVVKASVGHVRDLPKGKMGVDVEDDFKPTYVRPRDKAAVVKEIKEAAKQAGSVYLATDPDREGEAISWHIVEAAGLGGGRALKRVVFHEITRPAIEEAFSRPREIDMQLVNAQQARRILDRIVGYKLSPVLWTKVRRGLSAGRVQSVALRLIVDREREIQAFTPEEFWAIAVNLTDGAAAPFKASLYRLAGERRARRIPNREQAQAIVDDFRAASYRVKTYKARESREKPRPPFTTSTMQQEAARKLGFGAQRTMTVAQQLFEGIQLGGGERVGLITYMRTDSVSVAPNALAEANQYIRERYGAEYTSGPRRYRTSSRSAQEAHEAIRPTFIRKTPEELKTFLDRGQMRLYSLIWRRMVASQMKDALYDSTTADIGALVEPGREHVVRATGRVLKFAGFKAVYVEGRDDEGEENGEGALPRLSVGQALSLVKVDSEQKFTKPPPRYSEATLIQALEKKGIGRPSTYASIVGTIESRDYVGREGRLFKPTQLGEVVSDLLTKNFPDIMDPDFTSGLEEKLDQIAEGKVDWVPVLGEFYRPFDEQVAYAKEHAERVDRSIFWEKSDEVCEKCERPMVIKPSRYGKFLSCTGFPECRNGRPLVVRTGVTCPECGIGELLERKNRRGRTFYGCGEFPKCRFLVNGRPFKEPCPECGGLLSSSGRKRVSCASKDCSYKGPEPDAAQPEKQAAPA